MFVEDLTLEEVDPEIADLISKEKRRQVRVKRPCWLSSACPPCQRCNVWSTVVPHALEPGTGRASFAKTSRRWLRTRQRSCGRVSARCTSDTVWLPAGHRSGADRLRELHIQSGTLLAGCHERASVTMTRERLILSGACMAGLHWRQLTPTASRTQRTDISRRNGLRAGHARQGPALLQRAVASILHLCTPAWSLVFQHCA